MKFEIIGVDDSPKPFVSSSLWTEDDENYSINLYDTFNEVCERVFPNKPNHILSNSINFSINSIKLKKVQFHKKDVYRFYIEGSNNKHYVIKNNICGFVYFCKVNLNLTNIMAWIGGILSIILSLKQILVDFLIEK